MPTKKLGDADQRAVVLAALSGTPLQDAADEYGISYEHVRRLVRAAEREAHNKLEYWSKVVEMLEARNGSG